MGWRLFNQRLPISPVYNLEIITFPEEEPITRVLDNA